jgi:hypothetical protein
MAPTCARVKWAIEALTVFTQRSSWKYFHYQGDSIPNR